MVVGCWGVKERGEGDLGGEEGATGASTGGSSTTVVLCEGVWLLDETCVTVGDTATIQSVPAHRTERIIPAQSYWARTMFREHRAAQQRNSTGHTWRGHCLRQRRGRVLVSPDHVAVAMREPRGSPAAVWSAQIGSEALLHGRLCRARVLGDAVLGANLEVCQRRGL
jgi:hypothetical protein